MQKIAGWEGVVAGLLALYTATAQIWNDVYGRTLLPVGPATLVTGARESVSPD